MRDFYNFPKTEKTIDYAAKCEDKTINSVDIVPPRDVYTFRSNILLIRDKVDPLQKVRDLYTSDHKCPLATYPYNSSPILKAWKNGNRQYFKNKIEIIIFNEFLKFYIWKVRVVETHDCNISRFPQSSLFNKAYFTTARIFVGSNIFISAHYFVILFKELKDKYREIL